MNGTHKQIFIVITQTGTMLSRILKRITGAEYNHASLSLSQDLTRMYSFGRRHPYNPFWGGFVIESPHAGTFRRFSDTTAIILAVEITEERYAALEATLEAMWAQREQFSYNLGGLLLAYFHILWKRSNRYYCSEFSANRRDLRCEWTFQRTHRLRKRKSANALCAVNTVCRQEVSVLSFV